jgi:uncharacterized protein (TIGR02001 family)
MKTIKLALLAAVASLAVGGVAQAQDAESPVKVAFNIGAASDYVFRGISQTDEDPQIFGGVDATIGMGYVGFWASNVDFGNSTTMEYDIYGGFKPTLGAVALDLGVIYYGYADKPAGPDEAYWEFKAAGSVPVGPATVGLAFYYSPEFFGETGTALYSEINGSVPIKDTKFSVSGAFGHQEIDAGGSYSTWNLGVGFAVNDHLGFDLRYWDTDEHSFGKLYDARVVLGAKVSF